MKLVFQELTEHFQFGNGSSGGSGLAAGFFPDGIKFHFAAFKVIKEAAGFIGTDRQGGLDHLLHER